MMKRLYQVLAYLIAAGVVLQAAAIAYAVFGMFEWVSAGGTIDKALIESDNPQLGGIDWLQPAPAGRRQRPSAAGAAVLDHLLLRPDPRRYQMGSDRLHDDARAKPSRHLRAPQLGGRLAAWCRGTDLVHQRGRLRDPGPPRVGEPGSPGHSAGVGQCGTTRALARCLAPLASERYGRTPGQRPAAVVCSTRPDGTGPTPTRRPSHRPVATSTRRESRSPVTPTCCIGYWRLSTSPTLTSTA